MHDGDSESAESRSPTFGKARRGRRFRSIRQRVVRVALVPSIGLIVLWLIGAGYLGYEGFYFNADASATDHVAIPGIDGFASLQKERQLSMAELADHNSRGTLAQQRRISDQKLTAMQNAAKSEVAFTLAPQSIKSRYATLVRYIQQLPTIRDEVDKGSTTPQKVYAFYNKVLTAATAMFDSQSRGAPAAESVQVALTSTDIFRASDVMSRAGSQAASAFTSGKFSSQDYLAFADLVGAYHAELASVQANLQPGAQAALRKVMQSNTWTGLTAAEDALLSQGAWTHGVPQGLPVDKKSWFQLTSAVSNQLINVTKLQANEMDVLLRNAANAQVAYAVAGTLLAAAVVAFAIFWALRQSNVLVGRTLVPRIRQLGTEANTVVRVHLPGILRRLAEGEQVDARSALPQLSYVGTEDDPERAAEQGEDEIDRVAQVLNEAMVVAVEAAIRESEARAGAQKVFLGIAYRNQKPLQQVLTQLDAWEQTEQDADRLDQWFKIHYLITQVRGVTESLIILGGGQPGRKWRSPVLLRDVLRSAISQANQYPRIRLEMAPEAHLSGGAVAGTIHLVTQLLNNAVEFSSPESPVKVRSLRVDTGVVIEVEDQGVGMRPEERDRINKMLREAPDFSVTALKDGSQLGFWVVAHLARRLNIRVELRDSPYGGVLAIALLPSSLLAGDRSIEAPPRPQAIPQREQPVPEAPRANDDQTLSVPTLGADQPSRGMSNGYGMPEAPSVPEPPGPAPNWPPSPPLAGRHSQPGDSPQQAPRVTPEPVGTRQQAGFDSWPVSAPPASRRPSPRVAEPQPAGSPFDRRDRPALPERRPQQHLAPQLREDLPQADAGQEIDMGSPDDIRARLSAFQQGTRAGRADE